MPVTVRVPTALRKFTGNKELVEAQGANIKELIDNLEAGYPGMRARLCDDGGNLRRFINIFVDGEDIRFLNGPDTELAEGREVSIVPSIAGG
jgi:molybdopterin synthase sulfur carrier subunit